MFNSDDYARGFKDGCNDGSTPKPKRNFLKMGLSWNLWGRTLLEGLTVGLYDSGGSNTLKTYAEGYKQGFNETLKARYVTQKVEVTQQPIILSFNQSNKNMGNFNDLMYQLQLLQDLKVYLQNYAQKTRDASNEYARKVNNLREAGMFSQVVDNYEKKASEPTNRLLESIATMVEDRDIPYLERLIENTESMIHNAIIGG